ncbi:MAG: ATP-binding protein, partial [Paracoccus sp. (in: a-proteobacteria)]|nr:ATP-binding protein [Paracoccus sp. (in: a-proteobacteria)]
MASTQIKSPSTGAAGSRTALRATFVKVRSKLKHKQSLLIVGFLAILGVAILTLLILQSGVRRQIDDLGVANSDSSQWFLAQAEVEFLQMMDAVHELNEEKATPQAADLAATARTRFDIVYSRLQTFRVGKNFEGLRADPDAAADLAGVQQVLDRAIPVIDGDTPRLIADSEALEKHLQVIGPQIRRISLQGLRLFAQDADQQRGMVAQGMGSLSTLVLVMLCLLAATSLVLFALVQSTKAQNRQISSARTRLRSLFDASIDAIVVAGADGRIVSFNNAAVRIYGYQIEEAIGADIRDLITPSDKRPRVDAILAKLQAGDIDAMQGGLGQAQTTAKHKSGRIIPVEVSMAITQDTQQPLLVAYVRDVSERVAEKAELIEARDRAVAGQQTKDQMITVMSHEMRTPLNGILGTLELLKRTRLDHRQSRLIQAMQSSGKLLLQHVNDVLDTSRAYFSDRSLTATAFDPCQMAHDLADSLQAAAQRRGNTLECRCFGSGQHLLGDEAKIRQVIVNLVGNAIKFTRNGLVQLELDQTAGPGHLEIRVTDTGIGIEDKDLHRIFDEFVTLGPTYDRENPGTGLGLSIVKRMIEAMGGVIDVVSTPNEGTAFTVALDLRLAGDPSTPDIVPPRPGGDDQIGLHVLVVEDNATNQMVICDMLQLFGCTIA